MSLSACLVLKVNLISTSTFSIDLYLGFDLLGKILCVCVFTVHCRTLEFVVKIYFECSRLKTPLTCLFCKVDAPSLELVFLQDTVKS